MIITEEAIQTVQQVNTLVATIFSLLLHGYIIRRLLKNYSVLTQYQNLVVAQSSVYITGSILDMCVNRTVTFRMEEVVGYPFIRPPKWIEIVLQYSANLVVGAEGVMLVIFNVHRLLIFLRPRLIKTFYVVTIPASLIFIVSFAYMNTFDTDFFPYLSGGFFVTISGITLICYIILRRHFRRNAYSDNVMRMQNQLSNSLLMQIIVHIMALALADVVGPIIILVSNALNVGDKAATFIFVIYMMVVYMFFIWYPVVIGAIIKWSISGLLSGSNSERKSVSEITFARRSTLRT